MTLIGSTWSRFHSAVFLVKLTGSKARRYARAAAYIFIESITISQLLLVDQTILVCSTVNVLGTKLISTTSYQRHRTI